MLPPQKHCELQCAKHVSQAADKAWTDAIAIDPSNPNAWSNRGTSRLQFGRWQDAKEDLEKALELESKTGQPSGVSQMPNAFAQIKKAHVQHIIL